MQHHCTKHKSCLGGVPGVQATPEDWCPSPFFSTKSNWQKLRGSNLNISVIKGKWQPSFLLDLLQSSPFTIMNAIPHLSWWHFMGDENSPTPLFFCKVKNFISGNKWAKVSSSPPRCEKSILLKLATKNCLDHIDHHSPSCLPELHNLAFCDVLQLQFAFDSKGPAARTWQFRTIILPKEVQLHSGLDFGP